MLTEYTQHKHLELCYRAFINTSFNPEKRAQEYVNFYETTRAEVIGYGGEDEKHNKLFTAWMHAKARCASPMITGPANFPTRRNEKANAGERKHGEAFFAYCEKVKNRWKKEDFYKRHPEAKPIRNDAPDALQRLQEKLAIALKKQAKIKATPPAQRHHSFELPYATRAVKEIQERMSRLQSMKLTKVDNSKTLYNIDTEGARVFFEFKGKPEADTRALLKKNGFRWTPSRLHWGRILTTNAIYAAKNVAEQLKE